MGEDPVAETINQDRRRFLGRLAMTLAATQVGMFGLTAALRRGAGDLAALGRATEWLNSPRLTEAELLGKVVVVNFCTYTCINWLRTLPYVRGTCRRRSAHTRVRL
jgi:hypothetical protein